HQKQKNHYSGKKKCHTSQHLIMTDLDQRVLVLSKATEGKVHVWRCTVTNDYEN
ncbi:MAG: hypothetical protein F6K08_32465, partial [Okeania sp. SIO1H6]|nr:hypothetical protein [Okeania sp. SIO1H6]